MPDFLFHLAAARVPGSAIRDRRLLWIFLFGTFLPDLWAKGLTHCFQVSQEFTVPTHSLAGLLALCYVGSLFLEPGVRRTGFAALYAGAVTHVLVDMVKYYPGGGGEHLLHPFLIDGLRLGWIRPENIVYAAPAGLAVLLAFRWLEGRRV